MLRNSKSLLPLIATGLLACTVVVCEQSSEGFINIDCGKEKDFVYKDSDSGLVYTSDFEYIDTGVIHDVDSSIKDLGPYNQSSDLRSFPDGARNCYTLKPVVKGKRYLVKANFMYGNYDGKDSTPEFDLYVGANFWDTFSSSESSLSLVYEIITITTSERVSICLVNTGSGTPFISALELRPVPSNLYGGYVNSSRALTYYSRINFGGKELRYPDDPYDRLWDSGVYDWCKSLATKFFVTKTGDGYEPPSHVMRTAIYPPARWMTVLKSTPRRVVQLQDQGFHVFLHFAELEVLDDTRVISITLDGSFLDLVYPSYLETTTVSTAEPISKLDIKFEDLSTVGLPPIVNAAEVYVVRTMTASETDADDGMFSFSTLTPRQLINDFSETSFEATLPNFGWM